MKKKISIWRILRWIIIVVLLFVWFTHPTRKPVLLKRFDILQITPKGSSWDEVVEAIGEQDGWRIMMRSKERGYTSIRGKIGMMSIIADLGRRQSLFALEGIWVFDENEKLINVYVFKNLSP